MTKAALAHSVGSKELVDETFALAVAAGATGEKSRNTRSGGGYSSDSSYFADPEGLLWEVAWNLTDLTRLTLPRGFVRLDGAHGPYR
jgi:predicted lactoylglutathione lyase